MATGYFIHTPSAEKQALERWENEGGLLGDNRGYIFDSIGAEYRRHKDQVLPIATRDNRGLSQPMYFPGSDKAKAIYASSNASSWSEG